MKNRIAGGVNLRFWTSLFTAILLVFLFSCMHCANAVEPAEPIAAVAEAEAEAALHSAFVACLDAGDAGANITGLMNRLNEAGRALGNSEIAYREGNVSAAVDWATQCSQIAKSVEDDVASLKSSALTGTQQVFWSNLTSSVVGVTVFAVSLFVVWWLFKRAYVKKLMKMKPEVVSTA